MGLHRSIAVKFDPMSVTRFDFALVHLSNSLNRNHVIADFLSDAGGTVAIVFALLAMVLFALVGAAVDMGRWLDARSQTLAAMDAAVLAGGRALQTTGDQASAVQTAKAYYANTTESRVPLLSDSVTFSIGNDGTSIVATGSASISTPFLSLISVSSLPLLNLSGAENSKAIVAQGPNAKASFEISMMLDLSGSMARGTKLADLKAAAKDLIKIVVRDNRGQYYSKLAIVPYATAVNIGNYAQAVRGATSSGMCNSPGCQYFQFTNAYGQRVVNQVSTCVSERTGAEAYTDAAPNNARVSMNYPSLNNPCATPQIVPLTSDKSMLTNSIDSMIASGSTGGQVGVAWGWYLLSPNWGYLWPSQSRPAAYGTANLQKIAILMTDGEYNSSYCQGVISYDSLPGSGSPADQINCRSPNGNSYDQSQKLCAAMKASGVTVFTVGFNVVNTPNAVSLLKNCASSSASYYDAVDGTALRNAFRDIALKISTLYLSQ
jgi:Flp pilus assembly protein TadG